MKLIVFNSLERIKSEIDLFNKKKINIYLCGPTVYDRVHVGNIRSVIIFDILIRLLDFLGIALEYVNNITDIDDKIIKKALEKKKSEREVSDFFLSSYFEVLKQYNIRLADKYPRVSDYISEIKVFLSKLIKKDYAYVCEKDILFRLSKVLDYGKLSGQDVSNLKKQDSIKKIQNTSDFVLWKNTSVGIKWDSDWGAGRPGWHTECAVFIDKIFHSNSITIHGGGIDLLFPHHENERAQFLAANNKELSDCWLHVAHINLKNFKMSKSEGNVIYADDFAKKYGANSLRYIIFSSHYRNTIDLDDNLINQSVLYIKKILNLVKRLQFFLYINKLFVDVIKKNSNFSFFQNEVIKTILDDLDTAKIFFFLDKVMNYLNIYINQQKKDNTFLSLLNEFYWILDILGMSNLFFEYDLNIKNIIRNWKKMIDEKKYDIADNIRLDLQKKNILP